MIVHVKFTIVGLSFCWRGRRRWIQPIQLCAEAEIVCPDEVLAQSVCEETVGISIDIHRAGTADPQNHKRLPCHWRTLREHSGSRYSQP